MLNVKPSFVRSLFVTVFIHHFHLVYTPKILHKLLTMVSSFSSVLQSSQEKSKTMLMLSYYFFAILVAVAVVTVVIQKFCHHGNMTSHFSSLFSVYYNFITKSLSPILNYQIVNSISYSYSYSIFKTG